MLSVVVKFMNYFCIFYLHSFTVQRIIDLCFWSSEPEAPECSWRWWLAVFEPIDGPCNVIALDDIWICLLMWHHYYKIVGLKLSVNNSGTSKSNPFMHVVMKCDVGNSCASILLFDLKCSTCSGDWVKAWREWSEYRFFYFYNWDVHIGLILFTCIYNTEQRHFLHYHYNSVKTIFRQGSKKRREKSVSLKR